MLVCFFKVEDACLELSFLNLVPWLIVEELGDVHFWVVVDVEVVV